LGPTQVAAEFITSFHYLT